MTAVLYICKSAQSTAFGVWESGRGCNSWPSRTSCLWHGWGISLAAPPTKSVTALKLTSWWIEVDRFQCLPRPIPLTSTRNPSSFSNQTFKDKSETVWQTAITICQFLTTDGLTLLYSPFQTAEPITPFNTPLPQTHAHMYFHSSALCSVFCNHSDIQTHIVTP